MTILPITADTLAFPWANRAPHRALEMTIAIGLALILGQLAGHPAAGSIAAGAAFTVGFAMFHEALSSALFTMSLVTAGIAAATLAGSLGAEWTAAVIAISILAAFNYGLLSGLGPAANWISQQCGTFAVVACYFPNGPHLALGRTAMVVAGGVLQMMVHSAAHLFRAKSPLTPPAVDVVRARFHDLWRNLQEELHWTAGTSAYTARLVLALLLTTFIYRHYGFQNGYWAPMTALLVLKPKWDATISRGLARSLGTLAAAAAVVGLDWLHPTRYSHWTDWAIAMVCAWACLAVSNVNYAAFSASLTLYTVFLFAFGGFSDRSAAMLRLGMTALGAGTALLVDSLWFLFVRLFPHNAASREQQATSPHAAGNVE